MRTYDGLNGFAVGTDRTHTKMDVHDTRDGEDLYRVLREEAMTACPAAGSSA